MEFNINFSDFCKNCAGECCDNINWTYSFDWGEIRRPVWKGDTDTIEREYGLRLIPRMDLGCRCMMHDKICIIYDTRPDTCRDYICSDGIFGSLEANL